MKHCFMNYLHTRANPIKIGRNKTGSALIVLTSFLYRQSFGGGAHAKCKVTFSPRSHSDRAELMPQLADGSIPQDCRHVDEYYHLAAWHGLC